MKDIALIGHMRTGKDSVAAVLTQEFGHQQLSFAARLKEAALEIDPFLDTLCPGKYCEYGSFDSGDYRLSDCVAEFGWDDAKGFPEVRRFLQNLGHAMRQIDPEIWIWPVLDRIDANWGAGVPTVVSDCRYRNEAETLRDNGFTLVRVVRPGTGSDEHVSETELDRFPVDWTISNDGDLETLSRSVRTMMRQVG